ncbi:MAG: hypothetical protein ABIK09_02820 [Pseudomonadota bacterium]
MIGPMVPRGLIVIALLAGLAAPAAGQERPTRIAEDFAQGLRPQTFTWISIAPTDPKVMYVSTDTGYIFATTDGGVSWTEARVVTSSPTYVGSIRPAPTVTGVPISAGAAIERMSRIGEGCGYDVRDLLYFDFGATGQEFLDTSNSPTAYDPVLQPGGMSGSSWMNLRHDKGGHFGALDARLGVGLTSAAPWLQVLLRSMGAPSSVMNMKALLVRRGTEPTAISMVAVDPSNPHRALAATAMGVFESIDAGVSWQLLYAGSNKDERWATWIEHDPFHPDHVLLGTAKGLLESFDGGERFDLILGTQLSGEWIRSLHFDPVRAGRILAGTSGGAFESLDGGDSWRWIFYETLKTSNQVAFVKSHSQDAKVIYLATHDGLYKTRDGGGTWQYAGGLLFTGEVMSALHVDPMNGDHLFTATNRTAWESDDGGDTWSVVYINDSDWWVRGIFGDPGDARTFWVVTTAELLRLGPPRGDTGASAAALIRRYRAAVAASPEPPLTEVMDATFRTFGVRTGDRLRYRREAAINRLLPFVSFEFGYQAPRAGSFMDYVPWSTGSITLDHVFEGGVQKDFYWGMLVLYWTLPKAVFDKEEAPFGRVFAETNMIYLGLRNEVQRFYTERVRLRIKLLDPDLTEPAKRVALSLRYEELTQVLNAYTDGLFQAELDRLQKGGTP